MLERAFYERVSELLPRLKMTLMQKTTAGQAFNAMTRLWDACPHRAEEELVIDAVKHALERFTIWGKNEESLVAQMCLLSVWSEHAQLFAERIKKYESSLMEELKALKAEEEEKEPDIVELQSIKDKVLEELRKEGKLKDE